MGGALASLLAGLALASQATSMAELRAEYEAIQVDLAHEETFEDARLALHDFVERLAADPSASPALLYHRARELALDRRLTPDDLERARYCVLAADAAVGMDRPDSALWMQEERSRIHESRGDLREASEILQRALADLPGATRQTPHVLVSLADLLRRMGQFDLALEAIVEIEAIGARDPDDVDARRAVDKTVLVRSGIYRAIGMPELAQARLEALRDALDVRVAAGEAAPADRHTVRIELLRVAISRGDGATVRRDAPTLLDELEPGSDHQRADVLLLLAAALLEEERSQWQAGEEPRPRARELFDEALALDPEADEELYIRALLVADALDRGDLERARGEAAALAAVPAGDLPLVRRVDAMVVLARVALETGVSAEELESHRAALGDAWVELVEGWRSATRLSEADGEGEVVAFLKYPHRRAVLSQLFQLEMALAPGERGVERAFAYLLEAQGLSTLAVSRPLPQPPDLGGVRRLVEAPGHGLLVYLPARDRSHAFAIDRESISHHSLPRSATVEARRTSHLSLLLAQGIGAMPPEERAEVVHMERERAEFLADALLPADLRRRIEGWSAVSINGTDTLGLVPFAWLPVEGERFLGCRHAIDFVPSLPHALARLAEGARRPRDRDLLVVTSAVGPDAAAADADLLAPSAREAVARGRVDLGPRARAALDEAYGPSRWSSREGDAASLEGLAREDLGRVATLQFLVHGIELPAARVPVALVLSPGVGDDGLLRASDVADLTGAPELVVLTACGSGQGPTRKGDPLVASPVGAWLAQGARAVVASHHDLTLGEARRTTRVLHAALRRGATVAEGMRDVRVDLAREEPELAPFLHALQRVVGLGHHSLFECRATGGAAADDLGWSVGTLALAGALAAAAVALLTRRSRRGRAARP